MIGQWVRWGRAALLAGRREGMGQAAVEMMLLPRLSPSPGHRVPWVKQSPAGREKGRLCVCGRAGAGAHTAGPGQRCLRLPVFFQAASGRAGQRGTSSFSVPAPANKVPFLLFHSLQLPAQAIQEEPQEPVETQRQRRAQTHPLERGERPRGNARKRDF